VLDYARQVRFEGAPKTIHGHRRLELKSPGPDEPPMGSLSLGRYARPTTLLTETPQQRDHRQSLNEDGKGDDRETDGDDFVAPRDRSG
jgi:hypothetical protein